jgi:hypothetical protein
MKTSLVIALTVAFVLAGGSALAVMNKACKSGHHPWCAPARTHVKVATWGRAQCKMEKPSHRCGRS